MFTLTLYLSPAPQPQEREHNDTLAKLDLPSPMIEVNGRKVGDEGKPVEFKKIIL